MRIKYKASEMDLFKKILIALGKETNSVDDKAKLLGKTLKDEKTIRDELKAEGEKSPRGNDGIQS